MGLIGANNEEKIWNFLYSKIGNKYGVAGLMGNLQAESALKPTNLQDSFESKLGYNDTTYTDAVDSGRYGNFIHDKAGYGLAQWTFWSRKNALLQYAKSKKVSIGNLEMQLEFLVNEIQGYTEVWKTLKNAKSVREASNIVLFKYEAPGNQGQSVQDTRASYSQTYYNRYAGVQEQKQIESNQKLIDLCKKSSQGKYIVSTGGHLISNSGSDERGKYSGGKAGDQTGNEWVLKYWYNRPWNCVLRYPDIKVGIRIAELGCEAALNDKIGYDQNERYTYWQLLQKAGYHPSRIKQACEADCSAGVIANVKAVGYLMNISKLKDISATYTGNMREAFRQAGFQVLTDSKYLNSDTYLLPGDILLNDVHHTATNISLGSYMMNTTASSSVADILNDTSLKYGSKGPEVKTMQEMLIACGYYCGPDGADGDFGKNTFEALKKFQKEAGLGAVDGWYGKQTKAALEAAYKKSKQKYASGGQKTYFVKVTAGALNIRTGPGTENPVVGTITDRGVYTIVETQGDWGKLKSGAGWICLKYTKKVNV